MKECIVLAGGFGTRLRQVVKDVPKCMAGVAGRPFLHYIFQYLKKQDVSHVILSLGYKSEVVIDWIKNSDFGLQVSYVVETEPLGTGGAIQYAMSKAETESVFVINGDTFFDVGFSSFLDFHLKGKGDISLCLKPMVCFDRYGSVELQGNLITRFNEKKYTQSGLINGGVYLVNKAVFRKKTFPRKFSFEKDILENKDLGLVVLGYEYESYFIDIGIPEDFEKANVDFKKYNDD